MKLIRSFSRAILATLLVVPSLSAQAGPVAKLVAEPAALIIERL